MLQTCGKPYGNGFHCHDEVIERNSSSTLLWSFFICVVIITPYIIAVSLHHVYPFLPTISLTAAFEPLSPSVLRSPQLLRRQNAKNASNGRKTLRKRLLRRLPLRWPGHNLIYIFKVTYYHLLPLKVLKSNIL